MSSITILEQNTQTGAPHGNEPSVVASPVAASLDAVATGMAATSNVTSLPGSAQSYLLKRTGSRPVTFVGREICSSTSHSVGPSLWYEINVYEKTDASYVAEVKMFTKSDNTKDQYAVYEASSLDDIASKLEAHDPASDVDGGLLKFDPSMSPGRFALQAASFRLQVEEAVFQYRDLVGELLFQLCD